MVRSFLAAVCQGADVKCTKTVLRRPDPFVVITGAGGIRHVVFYSGTNRSAIRDFVRAVQPLPYFCRVSVVAYHIPCILLIPLDCAVRE